MLNLKNLNIIIAGIAIMLLFLFLYLYQIFWNDISFFINYTNLSPHMYPLGIFFTTIGASLFFAFSLFSMKANKLHYIIIPTNVFIASLFISLFYFDDNSFKYRGVLKEKIKY